MRRLIVNRSKLCEMYWGFPCVTEVSTLERFLFLEKGVCIRENVCISVLAINRVNVFRYFTSILQTV